MEKQGRKTTSIKVFHKTKLIELFKNFNEQNKKDLKEMRKDIEETNTLKIKTFWEKLLYKKFGDYFKIII